MKVTNGDTLLILPSSHSSQPFYRSLTRSNEPNKKVVSFIHLNSSLQRHLRYPQLLGQSPLVLRVLMSLVGCAKLVWSYRTYATLWSRVHWRDMGCWWIVSRSDYWNGRQRTSCIRFGDYDAFDMYQYARWKDWSSFEGNKDIPFGCMDTGSHQ